MNTPGNQHPRGRGCSLLSVGGKVSYILPIEAISANSEINGGSGSNIQYHARANGRDMEKERGTDQAGAAEIANSARSRGMGAM